MSVRNFRHRYTPAGQGTAGQDPLQLTTTEIADAAIREIVQISLGSAPFDLFLDQLLVPNVRPFRWVAQLGQIRETRTALSGLFGRFVARAYLTRYCGHRYFEPIRADLQALGGWPHFTVRKNLPGDLPDWIVATAAGANAFAVAEAKGSHNGSGPMPSLSAAMAQARRIDIMANGSKLKVKRYAIATRWAVQGHARLQDPYLWVDDPDEGEVDPTPKDLRYIRRSIALGHYAAFAEGFGLPKTAQALLRAKLERPGRLDLPRRDQTFLSVAGGEPYPAIAAAVVPNGVIPLPRDGDLDTFGRALSTLFGERVAILAVRIDAILAADRLEEREGDALPTPPDPSFWRLRREQGDGSEQVPLTEVTLRPLPVG
ncbi:hypothetical protein LKMONMHP_2403 [Methylobacterium organophilum]|uniref:Uncharacterized protein n=1 Tax=Methylobacterium organophilum TaxID=410 RepID=A0ABQ4T7F6_METOR|nr:hypothetical protein LKMONMHP_2403 [Methylobacterium organophilum]